MRVAARRSATNERSPLGATRTPIRPVRWPAIRIARTLTPSRWSWATSDRPAPSRPIGADELRADAEPRQPAGDVRRRAALPDLDAAGDVRAALDRRRRLQHDVEHEVAEHEHAGRRRTDWARGGGGRHNADGSDAGPASRSTRGAVGTIPSAWRPPSTGSRSTRSERCRWTPSRRPTRGTPGRRWAPRRWPTSCGRGSCATRRRVPTGRTATGSSCPRATPRCSCTRSSTSPATACGLDELQQFRQWGSRTPGHPEHGLTPGVEATTGPLGQGFANAVGMAIAERRLAREFNRPGHEIVDHWTYVIASDGDLQEGIASEAASLAGPPSARQARRPVRRQPHPARRADRHGLVGGRPRSASRPTAGTSAGSRTATTSRPSSARSPARAPNDRPSLIAVRTHIGFGSPNKQDTQKAHGSPLGEDEVRLTKEAYGWDPGRALPTCRPRSREAHARARSTRARRGSRRGSSALEAYGRGVSRARPRSSAGGSRASSGAMPSTG